MEGSQFVCGENTVCYILYGTGGRHKRGPSRLKSGTAGSDNVFKEKLKSLIYRAIIRWHAFCYGAIPIKRVTKNRTAKKDGRFRVDGCIDEPEAVPWEKARVLGPAENRQRAEPESSSEGESKNDAS